jgi:hypothetical protein
VRSGKWHPGLASVHSIWAPGAADGIGSQHGCHEAGGYDATVLRDGVSFFAEITWWWQ